MGYLSSGDKVTITKCFKQEFEFFKLLGIINMIGRALNRLHNSSKIK